MRRGAIWDVSVAYSFSGGSAGFVRRQRSGCGGRSVVSYLPVRYMGPTNMMPHLFAESTPSLSHRRSLDAEVLFPGRWTWGCSASNRDNHTVRASRSLRSRLAPAPMGLRSHDQSGLRDP